MIVDQKTKEVIDRLTYEHELNVRKAIKEYAKTLAYKVGDTIKDSRRDTIGKITDVNFGINPYTLFFDICYKCETLTKSLKPFKKKKDVFMYHGDGLDLVKENNK